MKALLEKLPPQQFVRVHNSYIINIDHIRAITKNKVKIGEDHIPIGNTYKKHFFEILDRLEL